MCSYSSIKCCYWEKEYSNCTAPVSLCLCTCLYPHTYHRRPCPPPAYQDSPSALSNSWHSHTKLELPIALRKGDMSSRNHNPIYVCHLNYHRLSTSYFAFVVSLDSISFSTTSEAMSDLGCRHAMIDEMAALHSNGVWDLVPLPEGKTTMGCRWVNTVKIVSDGKIVRLKALFVAKEYTQIFSLDLGDTFSLAAKIASICLFRALAVIH